MHYDEGDDEDDALLRPTAMKSMMMSIVTLRLMTWMALIMTKTVIMINRH